MKKGGALGGELDQANSAVSGHRGRPERRHAWPLKATLVRVVKGEEVEAPCAGALNPPQAGSSSRKRHQTDAGGARAAAGDHACSAREARRKRGGSMSSDMATGVATAMAETGKKGL